MHTEALMGEATVMFLWGCVVHIYGAEWAALVQIQESMDVWFVTMKMHLECALRWSDCEWPWQTAVTDVDRNKSVMSELWGILLYTTSKNIDVLQLFCIYFECVDDTPSTLQQHKNLKCWQLCVFEFVCHFFLLGFSWQPFITPHHIHQLNMLYHEFTHIHLSFPHKYHIFHNQQQQKFPSNVKFAHDGFTNHW